MKRIVTLLVLFFYTTLSFSQEGNLFSIFFERAISLNANNEFENAEEQFRKAQQLLLEEFGLNETTHATYCHILYRRAHNLFLIDGMQDSSYVCFKELYDLSKNPIDTISGDWFRAESVIMLSAIDLERANIRDCCELLESEKLLIDGLDSNTRLSHKYYFYKNLAKTYSYVLVNLLTRNSQDFQFLNSQYVIVRDGSFYEEYISVYKELANLSLRFNKGDISKITEDFLLLVEHCRIPDDEFLSAEILERAFSMWSSHEKNNDITYLRLCNSYLSFLNKSSLCLDSTRRQARTREFDSIITDETVSEKYSYIDCMKFFSVRLQDKLLNERQKEVFVKTICEKLTTTDNYLILHFICHYSPSTKSLDSINNIKVLIRYFSLCSVFYYEQEEYEKADVLLNKAKFFSFLLSDEERLLLEELNNAVAKSAEIIGDEETYYSYKAAIITCKVACGILPSTDEWLLVCSSYDDSTRIAKIKEGIAIFGDDKYDKKLLKFYLSLAKTYFENNNIVLANENILISDSIINKIHRNGDKIPPIVRGDYYLCKAKSAYYKGDIFNTKLFAKESNENCGNMEALLFLTELSSNDRRELDNIVSKQYTITKSFIQCSYPFLSERERFYYSQSEQFQWFSTISRYADKYPYDSTLLSMAYTSSLISKGTNISVSTEIINKTRENNKRVLDEYLQQKALQVNDTNEVVRSNKHFYLEVMEKDMQRFSEVSPQYLGKYFGEWEDISSQLSENEIAIEFVEYVPIEETDAEDLSLGALYITKDKCPQIIRICNVTEIDTIKIKFKEEGLNSLFKIYDLVWLPILKQTQNIKRIWFSPSVHLFQTNIESALPDSIDAYRVSSTRNLFTLNDAPDFSEIALFGGLNYDEKEPQTEKGNTDLTAYHIMRESNIDEERVGLSYLKGSLNEVTTAQEILSPVNHNIHLFVDKKGTEDCFKGFSGKGVSLLHIATHGFYVKNGESLTNIGNRIMRKSGLFMSGAKNIWKGANEKYSGNDGILLSEEIECMNFHKLNLVLLSACGTGLGNATNDGVYGLQRAFKKAGAQTIIMSLWNVDDNATALMMETFYKELVKTKSKHHAFHKAQKAVRELFGDPYYWAGFIMLD